MCDASFQVQGDSGGTIRPQKPDTLQSLVEMVESLNKSSCRLGASQEYRTFPSLILNIPGKKPYTLGGIFNAGVEDA